VSSASSVGKLSIFAISDLLFGQDPEKQDVIQRTDFAQHEKKLTLQLNLQVT
jgi:hypothetical protein